MFKKYGFLKQKYKQKNTWVVFFFAKLIFNWVWSVVSTECNLRFDRGVVSTECSLCFDRGVVSTECSKNAFIENSFQLELSKNAFIEISLQIELEFAKSLLRLCAPKSTLSSEYSGNHRKKYAWVFWRDDRVHSAQLCLYTHSAHVCLHMWAPLTN